MALLNIYRFNGIATVLMQLIVFCAFFSIDTLSAEDYDFRDVDEAVERGLETERCPGASIAIVLGDQIVYSKGYGFANAETRAPVTTDTLFRLGSTTKMFTAAALLILAEEGKIGLHTPIGERYRGLDPAISKLTPHQLLTHTSGLADPSAMEGVHDETALEHHVRSLSDREILDSPATIYSYSNAGYWTAGLMIQHASDERYADFLNTRLLKPLGMKRSTFRPFVAMTWPLALGHGPEDRSLPRIIRPQSDDAGSWPSGQLFSTAPEFSRFMIAFMNDGEIDGTPILSKSLIDEMSKPHTAVPNEDRHYGYGLSVKDSEGLRWLSHSGSRAGYGSYARMCPEKKFGMVVLTNKTGITFVDAVNLATSTVLGIKMSAKTEQDKVAMGIDELSRYAGVYANGSKRLVLVARDDALYCEKNRVVTKIGERRFVAMASRDAPRIEFSMVLDDHGVPTYLMFSGRAYKRQPIETPQ